MCLQLESKDVKDPWNAHGYRRDVGLTGLHGCMPQLNSSNLRVVDLAGFKGPHMWPCLQVGGALCGALTGLAVMWTSGPGGSAGQDLAHACK